MVGVAGGGDGGKGRVGLGHTLGPQVGKGLRHERRIHVGVAHQVDPHPVAALEEGGLEFLGQAKRKHLARVVRPGPVHHRRNERPLGHARVGGTRRTPAPTVHQPGEDADRSEVDGAPAAEGKPEEHRSLTVSELFVAEAEAGAHQEVVDRTVRARMAHGPGEDGRGHEVRVATAEVVVGQPDLGRSCGTEAVYQDVGAPEQVVQVATALGRVQIQHDAALAAVPREEAEGAAGRVPARSFHLDHVRAGFCEQQRRHRPGDALRAVHHPVSVQDARPGGRLRLCAQRGDPPCRPTHGVISPTGVPGRASALPKGRSIASVIP